MKYRLPTYEDLNILREYVEEHYSNYEKTISGSVFLTDMNFKEWVDKINRNSKIADDEWGKYYVYLVFDHDKLVGLLDIRYNLTNDLREKYGDIGYGVRPTERKKGYATKMLKYAIKVCKEKKMDYVIVGCYDKNIGSNKTIINNGGKPYKIDYDEVKISDEWKLNLKCNYYKIEL